MAVTCSVQRHTVATPEGDKTLVCRHWHSPTSQQLLICVHGLTHNGRFFDELAQQLAQYYHVMCPDVLGRGDSDWLSDSSLYGYPLYIANFQQLLPLWRQQCESQHVYWLGTSMGGLIGMLLEAQQPGTLCKLILNDVGARIPLAALQRIGGYVGQDRQFASLEEAEAEFRIIAAPFGALTEAQWHQLALRAFEQVQPGHWRFRYDPGIAVAFKALEDDIDLTAAWQLLQCPVLVLRGSNSDLLTADIAAEMALRDDTEVLEIPGCGHAPMLLDARQIELLQHYLAS